MLNSVVYIAIYRYINNNNNGIVYAVCGKLT